jgi:hypothetical protein
MAATDPFGMVVSMRRGGGMASAHGQRASEVVGVGLASILFAKNAFPPFCSLYFT